MKNLKTRDELLESKDAQDEKETVLSLYKAGKSQAEIEEITGVDFDKIVSWTRHLGHTVGKKKDEDDRIGDDPSSKQYFDRTIKTGRKVNEENTDGFRAYKIPDGKRDDYFKFKENLDAAVGRKMDDANWDAYSDPIIKIGDISVFSKRNQDAIVAFMNRIGAKDVTEIYAD